MSLYKQKLPEVFPYVVAVPPHQIEFLVGKLVVGSSSFAVTVEDLPSRGYYLLWLSRVSYCRLCETDCLNGTRGE